MRFSLFRFTRTNAHELDIDAIMTQEIFLVVVQNIDAAATNGTGSNQADFNCHVIHSIQNRVSRDYTYLRTHRAARSRAPR